MYTPRHKLPILQQLSNLHHTIATGPALDWDEQTRHQYHLWASTYLLPTIQDAIDRQRKIVHNQRRRRAASRDR